jgi:hypothetical protein
MEQKEITIEAKDVYGRTLYYPACEKAKLFAKLIDKKTLTPETLEIAEKLGYTINIKQPEWR